MTHVRITTADAPGVYSLTVDDVDMSKKVLVEGFSVTLGEFPGVPARVTMVVGADVLDVDLPDAVIDAVRYSESEEAEEGETMVDLLARQSREIAKLGAALKDLNNAAKRVGKRR